VLTSNGTSAASWQAANHWHITGNVGTAPATNFIGTTDAQPLVIRVANTRAGYISNLTTTANYNAIGLNSLANNTGLGNSAFGYNALAANTAASNNSAFGYYALAVNTTGGQNSAFGTNVLRSNITGAHNSAFGNHALYYNTASYNSAVGHQALYSNTTGSNNTAVGYLALENNTTGDYNSAFGTAALFSNTTGGSNSAVGYGALYLSTGTNNSALGYAAGNALTTGSYNVMIGYNVQAPANNSTNTVTIGTNGTTASTYRIFGNDWTIISDRRLKHDIKPIESGLGFVKKLRPVEYVYNTGNGGKELGFIAQDVQQVMQEENMSSGYNLISVMQGDTLGMNRTQLIPVLTKAIQEQQAVIETQQQTIDSQKQAIDSQKQAIDALLRRVEALERRVEN
jgi:hypothetical protein